ncbi:MAG: DUF3489 domain-containing protein [Gammaproteobacteria bacterium]|nr:MAG: DUF3489 domain-containing protein [Gammaproteobacteria bacterium]
MAGLEVVQRHGAADGDHPLDQFELNHSDKTLPSKAAVVRALLRLEGGATLSEIMNATGWKACSCRSFLTSQRKHRRYKLIRHKSDGISRYTLEVLR